MNNWDRLAKSIGRRSRWYQFNVELEVHIAHICTASTIYSQTKMHQCQKVTTQFNLEDTNSHWSSWECMHLFTQPPGPLGQSLLWLATGGQECFGRKSGAKAWRATGNYIAKSMAKFYRPLLGKFLGLNMPPSTPGSLGPLKQNVLDMLLKPRVPPGTRFRVEWQDP